MIEHFEFKELDLKGAYLIKPFYADDLRGGFVKDYNADTFKANGIDHELKEVFYTISKRGVIRATHFQLVKQQASGLCHMTGVPVDQCLKIAHVHSLSQKFLH